MKEDLLKYMSQRSLKAGYKNTKGGPIVTISREKGCPANTIADKLVNYLNKKKGEKGWRSVNKEIIEKSAGELHVNPSKINHVIYSENKGFFRDLMLSFGEKYYESDVKVKKTLAELINQFAINGKVIVVGIGGVGITNNIDKSLHIKLHAPYKYRLKEVMKKEKLSGEKAREYMDETDVNRKLLIDYFNGIKTENDLFHAQFNCSIMSQDDIVKSIYSLMETRKLI